MAHDVLVVDDEADIRMLMCGILKDEGYETREAGNSAQALTAIRSRQSAASCWGLGARGVRARRRCP